MNAPLENLRPVSFSLLVRARARSSLPPLPLALSSLAMRLPSVFLFASLARPLDDYLYPFVFIYYIYIFIFRIFISLSAGFRSSLSRP